MCTKPRSDSSSPGLITLSRDGSLKTYPTPWPGLILSLIAPRMDRLFHFHTLSCFTWSPVLFVSYSSHSQHYPAVMLGPQHLITRPGRCGTSSPAAKLLLRPGENHTPCVLALLWFNPTNLSQASKAAQKATTRPLLLQKLNPLYEPSCPTITLHPWQITQYLISLRNLKPSGENTFRFLLCYQKTSKHPYVQVCPQLSHLMPETSLSCPRLMSALSCLQHSFLLAPPVHFPPALLREAKCGKWHLHSCSRHRSLPPPPA